MAASQDFQDFIDEVLERNDIVEVISEYAKLKRVGSRYAALCPLHNDKKSPSLSISPDKQLFHCFGCGAGGDAVSFAKRINSIDYIEAVKLLAQRAGMPAMRQRVMKVRAMMPQSPRRLRAQFSAMDSWTK